MHILWSGVKRIFKLANAWFNVTILLNWPCSAPWNVSPLWISSRFWKEDVFEVVILVGLLLGDVLEECVVDEEVNLKNESKSQGQLHQSQARLTIMFMATNSQISIILRYGVAGSVVWMLATMVAITSINVRLTMIRSYINVISNENLIPMANTNRGK